MITAVETFHRIICGQVEDLNVTGMFHVSNETLCQLKREMFPELDIRASYGWDVYSSETLTTHKAKLPKIQINHTKRVKQTRKPTNLTHKPQ